MLYTPLTTVSRLANFRGSHRCTAEHDRFLDAMAPARLFAGRFKNAARLEMRLFSDVGQRLVDLNLLCATYLAKIEKEPHAYDLADLWIPSTMRLFLEQGLASREVLAKILRFLEEADPAAVSGPSGERLSYSVDEVKLLAPVSKPEKILVVGFSDQTRDLQAKREAQLPTAFYKLPSTLVGPGEAILYPAFTEELDCDICLGVVIGKAGRRIPREQASQYIGGFTLLLDVTARDVCRQESITRNNLLGKNFLASTTMGPSLLLNDWDSLAENSPIELAVDGTPIQKFTLKDLIFSVEDVIAHWSAIGLSVGDVVALGASLALKSDSPPLPAALKPGSTVCCSCPAIGEMSHMVVRDSVERWPP